MITPAIGFAIVEKTSLDRSRVPPHPGQWSTIFTTILLPVQGCGTGFVGPVHVTLNIFPHIFPSSHKKSLAAAIIEPWGVLP